ncbi:putative nucleotidyltransferase substrate binding domain-containing protein [Thalassotalea atypica]|uniref:putative nucleotidyltransferase substrate binding domain-containing protein n=1 Tax=Thalassotalea atypica TaxID=2054316 RepID=UPI0025734F63|nr:putative nucleotidyltransferase substrate binding domain-containing protein [Thalassotalea atypica]
MDNELSEIYAFIKATTPFEPLSEMAIFHLVRQINICYVVKEQFLPPESFDTPHFYIVRKGALSYLDIDGTLLGKYGEGDICSIFAYPEKYADIRVHVDEDCLIYAVSKTDLLAAVVDYPQTVQFFEQSAEERLKSTVSQLHEEAIINSSLSNTALEQLYQSPAASINIGQSIADTARTMTELGYSCLVVVDNNDEVKGIVTDKDFRRRCIAQGISPNEPIHTIMTPNITTLDLRHTAFDALVLMTSHHIHHLPITKQGQLDGMLTITDLMHYEGQNAINLSSLIHRAKSIEALVDIGKMLPKLQLKMTKLGTTAEQVGKSISAITMAFTIRLIELGEAKLGEAPVSYAWLAAGSQARQEQFAHSDQDNALIIDNSVTEAQLPWFEQLAQFVCDGLNACGFVYCPGQVMATNPKWRQTEQQWHLYFQQWIDTPDPKALMHCSIFFDLTTVYGDKMLLERVRSAMLRKTQKSSLFIAHLSKNALQHKPPLGFFRDFVLSSNGKDKKSMDLKHNGVAPIVDLARIYALSEGISSVNTIERLQQASGTKSLTKGASANLIDAFEFLGSLRLSHQSNQLAAEETADNYLAPKEISRLEREHLKDAFKVIKTMQDNRQSTY